LAFSVFGRRIGRTRLESQLVAWRRYELELDAWLYGAPGDPRAPAEWAKRREARVQSQALARKLGATACARV
jgi:hypothetical protein